MTDLLTIISILSSSAIIIIVLLIIIYWVFYPLLSAPFVASSSVDILNMLALAEIKSNERVIDLGSGDGRLIIMASRQSAYAVGVEHNPFLTMYSKLAAILSANGPLSIKHKSYIQEPLAEYDIVFLYLLPADLELLSTKMSQEMAPGSRVISNTFKIPGWKPITTRTSGKRSYYLYEIGKSNKQIIDSE